ncbi:filamentous hemagglutinin N-terminal domain-containing protein [Pseudomonas sp. SG20056]|uniref:two-partner secretion domain-containing protein n=1 Tax=Pseudomonas sp. SG20056 TaxID=3074146 RepID=UPI00287FB7B4|nr:filamentous hemagglutinin N-terminal domain-containing protein [Pseudomonas sp. SG20056]WNF46925.1 filamentous hemagglutinin N-terminal domain-containing protein [Pseudomonas sp. SG20056]
MKRATLNHSYRLVWNKTLGAFVAVAELARSQRKGGTAGATALLLSCLPLPALATLPTGGTVEAGTGSISQNGNAMTINQGSDKLAINWQSFSIGAGNSVTFNQPGSSSVALNRVLGSDVSVIQGALNANGQVFLVNPNGVLFSPTAQVNVGSIVASTLNISTADFMAGNYRFEGNSSNAIINQGNIQAANGGSIALIAATISNTGKLTANGGNVLLGAGSRVTLDLGGPVKLEVEQSAIDALIEQGGAIKADGGRVYLTAKAAGDLASTVINHTGITEAHTLSTGEKGEIVLLGDMHNDRIQVAGTLDASAPKGGDGGFIETSAAHVAIDSAVKVTTAASTGKTGKWLIDPTDFTVSAGSAAQSTSGIGASTLQSALTNNNVEIQTSSAGAEAGDIHVNADLNWQANTLTLTAHGDLLLNSTLRASGNAGLALNHGWDGAQLNPSYANNGSRLVVHGRVDLADSSVNSLSINDQSYSILRSQADMAAISGNLGGKYVLGGNLNFSGNWTPISAFSGTLDGLGNAISGLSVNHSASGAGLFGSSNGANLANIRLVDVDVRNSAGGVGALVGNATNTRIFNAHSSGQITSTRASGSAADAGGLVGYSVGSQIAWSSSSAAVTTIGRNAGGLVGDATSSSSISNAFATGNVTTSGSEGNVGGLVGALRSNSHINNSYAWGNVSAQANTGGVTGVGGLVGEIRTAEASVANSYARGSVSTTGVADPKGGLIGKNAQGDASNITTSYWLDGLATSAGGTRISANQTQQASYGFTAFSDNWTILEGLATPMLKAKGSDAFMLNGNLSLESNPSLVLNQNIDSVSVLGRSALTLKSSGDIVLGQGRHIISRGGVLDTIFWADSNGDNSGGVLLDGGSANRNTLTTNGGHLWIGGGSGSTTWNGLTVGNAAAIGLSAVATGVTQTYAGINALFTDIDTGSGDIYLNGTSTQTGYRFGIGLRLSGMKIAGNSMTLLGHGSQNLRNADVNLDRGNWGVGLENSTLNATAGLNITGTGGGQNANGGGNHGVFISNSTLAATGSADLTITGSGGGSTEANNLDNDGIRINSGDIRTEAGTLTLNGTSGLNSNAQGIHAAGGTVRSTNAGDITLVGDTLQLDANPRLSGTGTLTIKPETSGTTLGVGAGSGTLQVSDTHLASNIVDGFASIILGSATTGNINVAGSTSYADNLTLKSAGDITLNTGASITGSNGQNAALVLWADADGSGAGSIYLMDGAAINSNGGHLWLGGGSGSTTWNGLTVGDGYAMGGTAQAVGAQNFKNGISLYRSSLNSAGGDIALYGKSANQSGAYGYMGIYQEQSSISSGAGDIDISAISTGSSNDGSWHYGLLMGTLDDGTASSISSTSGAIRINAATDFSENTFGAGLGLYSFNNLLSTVSIGSHSGAIEIVGALNSSGYDGQYGGIYAFGSGQEMIVSRSGNISLQGTSTNSNVAGINVSPGNSSSRLGYDGVNAYTGNITLNSNTFISYEGSINANQLELLGSGVSYTLTNTANNVSRLIGNTGSITYVDADALELGAITTSGALNIATLTGNLTLNGNLQSASTAADAIVLNAGKNALAGNAAGGNIIHSSGILSSGANARITLLTGSVAGSSGLAALLGSGSGRFRYNTDETSNGYDTLNAALGSGLYALYREQPLLLVTPGSASSALGAPISLAGISSTISGYANGDDATLAGLSGTASYSTDATDSSTAGNYQISYTGGLSNTLGYAIADNSASTGEYSIIGNTVPTSEQPVVQPPLLAAVSTAQTSVTLPNSPSSGSRAMSNADGLSASAQTGLEFVATDSADTPNQTTQGGAQPSGFMQVFVVNGGINVPSDFEASTDDENGEGI